MVVKKNMASGAAGALGGPEFLTACQRGPALVIYTLNDRKKSFNSWMPAFAGKTTALYLISIILLSFPRRRDFGEITKSDFLRDHQS